MNRILRAAALVLALLLLLTVGAAAAEKEISISTAEQLYNFLTTAENATGKLTKDITLTEENYPLRAEITKTGLILDLNGKKIYDSRLNLPKASNGFVLYVKQSGSLTITGNGTMEKLNHGCNMIYSDGILNVLNGTFKYSPYNWNTDCQDASHNNHHINFQNVGCLFCGRRNSTDYPNGSINVYGGTFDSGVQNPEKVIELRKKDEVMFAIFNHQEKNPDAINIYGGTIIHANPIKGDANGWKSNGKKNLFLHQQTVEQAENGTYPAPYIIEKGKSGKFDTYTTTYPFSMQVKKVVTTINGNTTVPPSGFSIVMTDTKTGEKKTVTTDKNGMAVFNFTASDMFKTFEITEAKGSVPGMTYSSLKYVLKVDQDPSMDYKPILVLTLDGNAVKDGVAVFENVYDPALAVALATGLPGTGDSAPSLFLLALLLIGSVAMLRRRYSMN